MFLATSIFIVGNKNFSAVQFFLFFCCPGNVFFVLLDDQWLTLLQPTQSISTLRLPQASWVSVVDKSLVLVICSVHLDDARSNQPCSLRDRVLFS